MRHTQSTGISEAVGVDLYFPFSSSLNSFWRLLGLSFMEKNKRKREMIDISIHVYSNSEWISWDWRRSFLDGINASIPHCYLIMFK